MTAGSEVVEDYSHVGLTLRQHPLAFLRAGLTSRRILPCAEAVGSRDRRRVDAAGLVLVRQRPGSAKGVLSALPRNHRFVFEAAEGSSSSQCSLSHSAVR